jgi:hypothetical protein
MRSQRAGGVVGAEDTAPVPRIWAAVKPSIPGPKGENQNQTNKSPDDT